MHIFLAHKLVWLVIHAVHGRLNPEVLKNGRHFELIFFLTVLSSVIDSSSLTRERTAIE
jgi:hypothetical protein